MERTSGKTARTTARRVALAWALTAVASSIACSPYSARAPKRLAIIHNHDANGVDGDGRSETAVEFVVGAFDSVPAVNALSPLDRDGVRRATRADDFYGLYPVSNLLGEGVILPSTRARAPPWETDASAPTLTIARVDRSTAGVSIEVVFNTTAPAWSCARVSGPIVSWSLSRALPGDGARAASASASASASKKKKHRVLWARHAGNGERAAVWRWTMDVATTADVDDVVIDGWALYPGESDELSGIVDGLTPHTSAILGTMYKAKTARGGR